MISITFLFHEFKRHRFCLNLLDAIDYLSFKVIPCLFLALYFQVVMESFFFFVLFNSISIIRARRLYSRDAVMANTLYAWSTFACSLNWQTTLSLEWHHLLMFFLFFFFYSSSLIANRCVLFYFNLYTENHLIKWHLLHLSLSRYKLVCSLLILFYFVVRYTHIF